MTNLYPALDFGPFEVAARSSVGVDARVRGENQDNYLLIDCHGQAEFLIGQVARRYRVPGWPQGQIRLAVLDGMGGHGSGREVAEAVVEGLLSIPACSTQAQLNMALDELHSSLQRHFGADLPAQRRPGTTLSLLELPPHSQQALFYHVGDSRLYALTPHSITPLSIDHVPATVYALAGQLDEAAWWQQVHASHHTQIAQAFVLGNAFSAPQRLSDPLYPLTPLNLPPWLAALADRRSLPLSTDCTYLLASDGCWACPEPADWVASWPQRLAGAASADALVDSLCAALEQAPPPGLQVDNFSLIALRFSHKHCS